MPKAVDHAQRRREIAAGMLRLVARDGLEAVSIRTVAAECGMSAGAVQKYFATKDEILMRALELTEERLTARYSRLDDNTATREFIRLALPLDTERQEETVALTAFGARTAARRDWAEFLAKGYAIVQETTAEHLRAARRDGRMPPGADADDLAAALMALTDGFGLRILMLEPGSPEVDRLLRALDTAVVLLLEGGPAEGTPSG